jgi:hypothetical protein
MTKRDYYRARRIATATYEEFLDTGREFHVDEVKQELRRRLSDYDVTDRFVDRLYDDVKAPYLEATNRSLGLDVSP